MLLKKLFALTFLALFTAACSTTAPDSSATSSVGTSAESVEDDVQAGMSVEDLEFDDDLSDTVRSTDDELGIESSDYDGFESGQESATSGQFNAPTQEDLVTTAGDRVFFSTDSSALSSEARDTLERQADFLKQYPDLSVTIEGHCDERGTREYNLALGERRGNSAKDYLVALGVDPSRMTVVSFGKERPAVLGSNPSAWSRNRRAVVTLD